MNFLEKVVTPIESACKATLNLAGNAARALVCGATQRSCGMTTQELQRAVGQASTILQGGSVTPATPSAPHLSRSGPEIAEAIIQTYRFDRSKGQLTFSIPAGTTDVEVISALNEHFKKNHSPLNRGAVFAPDVTWYARLPKRDHTASTQVTITPLAYGTVGKTRGEQEVILRSQGLRFADPRDLTIAAALHACTHDGENLLRGLWVRGSEPGFGLDFDRRTGFFLFKYHTAYPYTNNAAAGAPL